MLQEWGFAAHSESVTLNFNTTNSENIYAEEEDGVDYLRDLYYYDQEMFQMDMDSSQNDMTDMSEFHNDDNLHSESESENTDLNASAASISSRSNEQYVINSNVTFVSDNASDICKALRVYGQVRWFGCFGHHLNLVVRVAFKTNMPAAKLLRKCKMSVCSVN